LSCHKKKNSLPNFPVTLASPACLGCWRAKIRRIPYYRCSISFFRGLFLKFANITSVISTINSKNNDVIKKTLRIMTLITILKYFRWDLNHTPRSYKLKFLPHSPFRHDFLSDLFVYWKKKNYEIIFVLFFYSWNDKDIINSHTQVGGGTGVRIPIMASNLTISAFFQLT